MSSLLGPDVGLAVGDPGAVAIDAQPLEQT
jgi:hypothetical protein